MMISYILALSVLSVLVVGGVAGVVVKFTIWGKVNSNVENRINIKRLEEVTGTNTDSRKKKVASEDLLDMAEKDFSSCIDKYSHSSHINHVMS